MTRKAPTDPLPCEALDAIVAKMRELGIGRLTMGSTVVDLTEPPAPAVEASPEAPLPEKPLPYEVRETRSRRLFVDTKPATREDELS